MESPVRAPASAAAVLRLAGPAILAQLLQTGVLYADRVMLGHHSATALGAMHVAGTVEWTLVSLASAYAVGTLGLVGRAVGAGDRDAARRHTALAVQLAVLIGAVTALIAAVAILPLLPRLFPGAPSGPGTALAGAQEYLSAALYAAPFYCVGAAGFAALSGSGDTVTPLGIGVVVNVVHVGVNWILIPRLGARGAGISTAASFALEAALTLLALARAGRPTSLRPFRLGFARADLRALVTPSVPALLERLVYHAAYMAFVWMTARLGDDAMAGNQVLIAVEALSFMTVEGFATAAGALVAQELGAGRRATAARVGWLAAGQATLTLSTFGVGFYLLRHRLPALVTPRADLQQSAAAALVVCALAQPFMGASVVLGQALRGAGATRLSLLASLFAGFGVRLVATWYATTRLSLGLTGVWIGSTADWVLRTVVVIALWGSKIWAR